MSDDVPVIFAHELSVPAGPQPPSAVFLSASSSSQMQQYSVAGWRVFAAPGFQAVAPTRLSDVPAEAVEADAVQAPALVSCEAVHWDDRAAAHIARWKPDVAKVNCAFYDIDAAKAEAIAASLQAAGYDVLAAHWRDDNTFAIRMLSFLDRLAAFEPPEWERLNLIAVREAARVKTIYAIGRLYVGEEMRIGELRVAQAIRNDYIARLEDALQTLQKSR